MNVPEYMEVYDAYKVDANKLAEEFETVRDLLQDRKREDALVLSQKTLFLYRLGRETEVLKSLPYTRQVVYDILKLYNFDVIMYRCIQPYSCYNWHKDGGNFCFNIPIITNESNRFVYEDKAFYMPADGSVYLVNNSRYHSFMNGGSTPRIHITCERAI